MKLTIILSVFIILLSPLVSYGNTPLAPTGLCINDTNCTDISNLSVTAPKHANIHHFNPGYYMLVGQNEGEFEFSHVMNNTDFVGVKKLYRWVDLEVSPGVYDFSEIENDLKYVQQNGKRLFIQIIEIEMGGWKPWVPKYMWRDESYGCGATGKLSFYYGVYERTVQGGGTYPCYWNEKVRNAFYDLYTSLGNRFNNEPYFEGIALSETSVGYCRDCGYNVGVLKKFYQTVALRARAAFSNKTVIQMMNYAPSGFDLVEFAAFCAKNGIGIGGPDVHLNAERKQSLNEVVYPLYLQYHDEVITGIDVQWDNYERYGQTPPIILQGAIEKVNPYYIFWQKREPFFSDEVVPLLRKYGPLPAAKAFYDSVVSQGNRQ